MRNLQFIASEPYIVIYTIYFDIFHMNGALLKSVEQVLQLRGIASHSLQFILYPEKVLNVLISLSTDGIDCIGLLYVNKMSSVYKLDLKS